MDLSVSIVSWNTRELLDKCLGSIYLSTRHIEFEVVVIDNASGDGSSDLVRARYPQAVLVANERNVGFATANNQAYKLSQGRYFMLLNPDTICHEGTLEGLVRFLDGNPHVGAAGPLVLNSDGSLQYSWARFPTVWSATAGTLDRHIPSRGVTPRTAEEVRVLGPFPTDWVGGCSLVIRRSAVEDVGLMDESLFMYSEETDWCYRLARAGWQVWIEPSVEIVHLGGQASAQIPAEAARHLRCSKVRYFAKHKGPAAGAFVGCVLALKSGAKRAKHWLRRGS